MNKGQMALLRQAEEERQAEAKAAFIKEEADLAVDDMAEAANYLAKIFACTVALLIAFYMGFTYQEWAKAVERDYFSEPDNCGTFAQQQNRSMYEYALERLKERGEVLVPETVSVASIDNEDPSTWILGGNNLFYVEEGWWHVAVDTDMSGISGAMLRDWFNNVNCSDMYRWWHPLDHVYGVWLDDYRYSATSDLVARQGKIHRVKEYVDRVLGKLDIIFLDPCVGKDCDALKEQGVELILSARITSHQTGVGRIHAGNFIHTLRVDDTGSTLHSRFSMGRPIRCIDNQDSWGCYLFESFAPVVKRVLLSEKMMKGIFRHCSEEMFVLGRVIAKLHSAPLL